MHQVNRIIGLLYTCLLLTSTVNAQWNEYPAPKVEKIFYNKWDKKYGIRYYLPTYPAKLLDSIFFSKAINTDVGDLFFNVKVNGDTLCLYGHIINGGFMHLNKQNPIRVLCKITHRYILVNGQRIPFYFDTDISFGFPDFILTGYNFYIKFVGGKHDDGKILECDY